MKRWSRWQDWATVALGAGLMAMPLITQTTSTAAICAAYGMGGLIVASGIAAAAMTKPSFWSWASVAFGALLIAMPWVFQFTGETAMAGASRVVGAGTIAASGFQAVVAPRVATA